MNYKRALGFDAGTSISYARDEKIIQYINLKLAALGAPIFKGEKHQEFIEIAHDLIENHIEKNRLLSDYLCPVDQRIQNFLNNYLSDIKTKENIRLPSNSFVLDRHGLARVLSLPPDKEEFISGIVSSYRIKQGVLHNPKNDRRTTKGVFHIAEGGLPIPDDKISVPKDIFARILSHALNPPRQLMQLPFSSSGEEQAEVFVSLLLRPIVCPEIKGLLSEKTMEIHFFVPGNLVCNLDFVESIFGNAGDPYLPENDAALDIEHWTGHTGFIILAPHLTGFTKKSLGLPEYNKATDRQRRDGMCWKDENEKYNNADAFKLTARTDAGVIVTIIADNYFGYCKKEIKTQISYSANLYGNVEEEHAGGAIAFPSYNLGDDFLDDNQIQREGHNFKEMIKIFSDVMEVHPEDYAVDKNFPNIIYVPEDAKFNLNEQRISWNQGEKLVSIKLLPHYTYFLPAGYKIRLEKHPSAPSWRLVGTVAEGTFCHKPSTVSGGGKSEISKSISDSILYGPYFVADPEKDFQLIDEILNHNYIDRYKVRSKEKTSSRPLLSYKRSLGSAIKLLTPSPTDFTDEYNAWLNSIPQYIKGLVFIIKRFYRQEWEGNWRDHFSVDIINGNPGNELKYNDRKLVAYYLRVGLQKNKSWRTFKLRQDYIASDKLQMEDDITASVVVPAELLGNNGKANKNPCLKIVENCEYRFFQRPDEAINRGFDRQAELDIATPGTFISNFEPLTREDGKNIIEDAIGFDKFTSPMKNFIREAVKDKHTKYFVSSAHPRMINGKPSVNMRYLQNRPDLVDPQIKYIAEMGIRLFRRIPLNRPFNFTVNAVLPGRRNNPPDIAANIRALCVYNPIHYQELPEMFMDFICSVTGKSPSTTGAGSEGALTKGPFNALSPIHDLNNALVSYILTGYDCFTTAAGFIGPNYRIDHDISLLIPEIWGRINFQDRDPKYLINGGFLEKLNDFEFNGKKVLASRLGYRITEKFVHTFFGKVFENPFSVFNEEMLKPELQSIEIFVNGINNIVEAQERVAKQYFNDGSIESASPPLKAILNIMAKGNYKGKSIEDKSLREMFTRDHLFKSEWYVERLITKQLNDIELWQKHVDYLKNFLNQPNNRIIAEEMNIQRRLEFAESQLQIIKSTAYLKNLHGWLGTDPLFKKKNKTG